MSGGSSVESRGAAVQTRSSDLGYGSRIWYPKPSLDHCSNVCPRFLTHFFFFGFVFIAKLQELLEYSRFKAWTVDSRFICKYLLSNLLLVFLPSSFLVVKRSHFNMILQNKSF